MTVKETSSAVLRPRLGWVPVRRLNFSRILLLISAPVLLLQLFSFISSKASSGGSGILPVSIRAESQADYRSDPQGLVVPGISGNILLDIIQDSPGNGTTAERVAVLEAELSADIPTMTPQSEPTPTPTSGLNLPIDPLVSATSAPLTVTVAPPVISTPTAGLIIPTLPVQTSPTVPPLLPTSTSAAPASASPTPILPTLPPLLPTLPPILPTPPPLLPTLTSLFP